MTSSPTPRRTRPGRPARTSVDAVVEAAIALGLDSFTLAAVAEHLGVAEGTVYNYVPRREDLYALAAARVLEGLDLEVTANGWMAFVEAIAERSVELAARHAGLREYLFGGPYEPSTVRVFETLIAGIERRLPGLTEDEAFVLISRPIILSLEQMGDPFLEGTTEWLRRALLIGMDEQLRQGQPPPTEGRSWRLKLRLIDDR